MGFIMRDLCEFIGRMSIFFLLCAIIFVSPGFYDINEFIRIFLMIGIFFWLFIPAALLLNEAFGIISNKSEGKK